MDICLLTAPIPIADCDLALTRLRDCLQRFQLTEGRHDTDDEREAYRARLADVARRRAAFARAGWTGEAAASRGRPYQWLCAAGDVELAGRRHIVHAFVCPSAEGEAALSLLFEASLWRALHGDREPSERIVDGAVHADFTALIDGAVASFATSAFGVLGVEDPSDLARTITPADVRERLDAATLDVVRRWPLQLAGIRRELIELAPPLIARGDYAVVDLIS